MSTPRDEEIRKITKSVLLLPGTWCVDTLADVVPHGPVVAGVVPASCPQLAGGTKLLRTREVKGQRRMIYI